MGAAALASAICANAQTARNPFNVLPTRTVGQARQTPISTASPNFLEGRELFAPQSVAADTSSNPPILYVADSGNNRILAWRNPSSAQKGAPADLVIGQRDYLTTLPQGPEAANVEQRLVAGFNSPSAIAVDASGNLYVADAGNNRIVRYPRPFDQVTEILQTDLVIGQRSISSGRGANQNTGPSAKALFFSSASTFFRVGLAIDGSGNLWVSDPGNNRVLRFPSSQLNADRQEPVADTVIGQLDFTSSRVVDPPNTVNPQLNKAVVVQPSGISVDSNGRLFVCDSRQRVLMYAPPLRTGMPATRVLGTSEDPQLSATRLGGFAGPPEGVFSIGTDLHVIDTGNNRILRYGNPDNWPAETATVISPAAVAVIGQADFVQNEPNRNFRGESRNDGFFGPIGATVAGGYLWVADANNNRVIGFPQGSTSNADRLLGQVDFQYRAPNIVKRSGFNFSNTLIGTVGSVAVDYNSNPPRMYVADTGNNRVLAFRDARNIRVGDLPDLVIGQSDFNRNAVNFVSNDPDRLLERGFNSPAGVAVDPSGDLWVADTGNGRVMRFPKPFEQPNLGDQRANLCLGQINCFARPQREATSRTMSAPIGMAFMNDGHLAVSDFGLNRVLLFRRPAGGDFSENQAASLVIGQRDFISSAPAPDPDRLNSPRFITIDTSDRLYIADTLNNRIFVRALVGLNSNGAQASYVLGTSSQPTAVSVSRETGNIWVTFPGANLLIRFPEYQALIFDNNPQPPGDNIFAPSPVALALDPQDNPIVAEAINRISFYYPRLDLQNSANLNRRLVAPGMLANVSRIAGGFGEVTAKAPDEKDLPLELADVEVLVDDTPAPLLNVSPSRVQLQIPTNFEAPKQIEMIVRRKSNGQVLGALTIPTEVASPGFFTRDETGTGQIVAQNEDGSPNENVNGATRGTVVKLFGTGLGRIPNMPQDGKAPTADIPAGSRPIVQFGARPLADGDIKFFGLAAGMVGMFRLDIVVPANAGVNAANPVGILWRDLLSRDGLPFGVTTTVWVR